jgi:hypothetical protein
MISKLRGQNLILYNYCYKCRDFIKPLFKNIHPHIGVYCPHCGGVIKWVTKKFAKEKGVTFLENKPLF